MRVFIVNVGQQNYLWPDCLRRNTVATVDNVAVHHFWEQRDRKGFIEHALAHLKTARNETPTRAVASRWYGLMEAITETDDDIWIHREKEQLWWTTSLGDPVQTERRPSFNAMRDGPEIFELHKPCEPWSDRNRKGGKLSWDGLHPKAKDFLFTEGTLQQLAPDNATYALALIAGDDLSGWHNQSTWRVKSDRAGRSAVMSFSPAQRAAWRMADTALATAAQSNGQQALRTIKNKDCLFTREELREYIQSLILDQDELCAITGIPLQFDGAYEDSELLASLDRIDSSGHYERGNLQVVCQFVNRWKSDARDEDFRRLIELVRTSRF
jgi:hypothetical protein